MKNEVWRKLIYPNLTDENNKFEISTFGRLRNKFTHHVYKPYKLNSGYYSVRTTLGKRSAKIHILIHKAVAYTFLSNPSNLPEVNHKDGNKANNYLTNLEWCTSSYNQKHKYKTGLVNKDKISGENNNGAKLTTESIKDIRNNYIPYSREFGARAFARKYNVSKATVQAVINNKTWINI